MEKSPERLKIKEELKELQKKGEAPLWMKWFSYAMLKESYLEVGQTPKQRFWIIAKAAAQYLPSDNKQWERKFFELFWNNWLAPSTPVMGNLGTDCGLAVSCSASYVGDSMWDIAYTNFEIAMLSKNGFGTAAYFDLRPGYQPIATGGYTNPVSDWLESYWYYQNKVSQGSRRRGSTALYLDFWHGDLMKVLPMLETHDKLHLGVICDDSVKEELKKGNEEAWLRYKTILMWRARKGKPYIIFIDNARRQDPEVYKKIGWSTKQSNLCTEIFQHTDSDHTLACVLSSMVGNRYLEWKNTDAVFTATVFLDCVNQDLIVRGSKIKGLERVVRSAEKSRSLGLGMLGFHTYLQQLGFPIDSFEAKLANADMFKHLHDESLRASKFLAEWLGEPEIMKGTGLRNAHRTAIAPNTSSAFIAGAVSQGVELFIANVAQQKLAKVGSIERINPVLVPILKERGKYTEEVIDQISYDKGSVKSLNFLSDHEKEVFKTAYEVNQKVLIDLAEQRQRYICQGQSLNLFFDANEDEQWIHEVHRYAFEQKKLKSLYYVRTQPGISADKGDECKSCEG